MLKNLKTCLSAYLLLVCSSLISQEICDNAIDDDGDGLIDLLDEECDCPTSVPLSEVTGFICLDNLRLIVNDQAAIGIQWYKDGIALIGETSFELLFDHQIDVEGTYTAKVELGGGCYLTEPYELEILTHIVDLGEEHICRGDTVSFGVFFITTTGFFQNDDIGIDGCDSITYLDVYVLDTEINFLDTMICVDQVFELGNVNTSIAGDYTANLINSFGCDSIVNVSLSTTDFFTEDIEQSICQGDVFNFRGEAYSVTGQYQIDVPVANGCDSLFNLDLKVEEIPLSILYRNICEGEEFIFKDIIATTTDVYETSSTAPGPCDSLFQIHLTVEAIPILYLVESICLGEVYEQNGFEENTSGIYTNMIDHGGTCDSIITLDLTVSQTYEELIEASICEGMEYVFRDLTLSTTGIYDVDILSQSGCDSIFTIDLTVNQPSSYTFVENLCQGEVYYFHGTEYQTTGKHEAIIPNHLGCDSTITLDLLVHEPTVTQIEEKICSGEIYLSNINSYELTGLYEEQFMTSNGCDSLVMIDLLVEPIQEAILDVAICIGESFMYETIDTDKEGSYQIQKENAEGCDSLITINLTIVEPGDGIEIEYYHLVSYGSTIDIVPDFMGPGLTNFLWFDDLGNELGTESSLMNFGPLQDVFLNLIAIDANGCQVEARSYVDVEMEIDIFIPNVFTPNGDEDNDYFQLFGGPAIKQIKELAIFDRWGERMYTTENVPANLDYQGWDGIHNNKEALPGVYTYRAIFEIVTGATIKKTGSITLIR